MGHSNSAPHPLVGYFPEQLYLEPEALALEFASLPPERGSLEEIGRSREGRPLFGVCMGRGPRRLSLIAGAHADEPIGPVALRALIAYLAHAPEARPILDATTFVICPHVNPDGAERNAAWIQRYPCPLEYYLEHVVREQPGDDVEFGFGSPSAPETRPENAAVARFLASRGPYALHATLHGMSLAEGAWFLIGKDHVASSTELRAALVRLCDYEGFGLHDWDRAGEKGFSYIAPGFSTSPTCPAMQQHFLEANDPETAGRFALSSMDYVSTLGSAPLCVVSEMPLYLVSPSPNGQAKAPNFMAAKDAVLEARIALVEGRPEVLGRAKQRFGLDPVPVDRALRIVLGMVLLAGNLCSLDDLL